MAYAVKYLFKFQSSNGTVREIRVLKDGYSGDVIQRPLGRAPVIKKEKNGGVHGTSLTFYAECHIDREYIEFYTSDPKEYRVDVYAGSTLLWQGYITPELYSEPDIAPPYDVQVVATDGVGELKLYDFAPQGTVTLRALLTYLLGYTGLTTDVNLVSSLKPGSRGAGALLDMQICVDYLAGKTCYEALTYILTTLHATITRWGGAWVLVRETNVTFTSDKVRYFNTSGNSALLTGSVQTLGAMRSAPAWPVGQLSTVIDPAKNKVVVQAPWHPVTGLTNPDMTSDTGWTKSNGATYSSGGYLLPNVGSSAAAFISQTLSMAGLRTPTSFELRVTGVSAELGTRSGAVFGVLITYTVGSTVYLLRKGDEGTPVWQQGTEPGPSIDGRVVDYQQPIAAFDADRIQAETLRIDDIPAFVQGTSYPSGTLKVYIVGDCALVYGAHLDVVLPKGYQDVLRIDNGARGEGDSVEIAIGRVTSEVAYYQSFLQGLLLDTGSIITAFSDANFTTAMDYLALISRDYALSAALPRALAKGTVYLESSIGMPPLVFAKGGLNYWLDTWSWDLYEDELEIDARTLPSASLTVQSETILESDGSTVSSSSSGSSGGGSSISPGGGVQYFEPHNDGIILKSDYDYVSVPDVLLGDDEESLTSLLAVIAGNAAQGAAAYGYFNNGVLPYNHGGTGFSTYTKGDLLYASANNTLSKLAANSTGTKKFLTMTSSVPSWGNIAFGDLPTLYWANVAVSSSSSTTTEPTVKSITIGGATLTWVAPVGTTPGYLKINSALLTDGDQIVGGGTPGGGGGGGASYLSDLLDVKYGLNPSADDLLIYSSSVPLNPDGTITGPGWTTIAKSSVGRIYTGGTGITIGNDNTISVTANTYVLRSGDTMTGGLTAPNFESSFSNTGIGWGVLVRNTRNADSTGYGAGIKLKNSADTTAEVNKWGGVAYVASEGYSNAAKLAFYVGYGVTAPTEKMSISGDGTVAVSGLLSWGATDQTTWNISDPGIRVLGSVYSAVTGSPGQYYTGFSVWGYYGFQLASNSNSNILKFRSSSHASGTYADWVTILHSGNYTSYTLALTGGTINTLTVGSSSDPQQKPLTINAYGAGNTGYIKFTNSSTILGHLGVSAVDTPAFMNAAGTAYTIYHSGNFNPANYLPLSAGSGNALTNDLYTNSSVRIVNSTAVEKYYALTNSTGAVYFGQSSSGFGYAYVGSAYPFIIFTNGTQKMRITSGGDVGIGTDSPDARLHAVGAANAWTTHFQGSGSVMQVSMCYPNIGAIITSSRNESTDTLLNVRNTVSSTVTSVLYVRGDGNIGIGTGSPGAKLNVYGDCIIGNSTSPNGRLKVVGTDNSASTVLISGVQASGTGVLYVYNDGHLVTSGDQTISSDLIWKTNLQPVKYTIEDIARCRAVTFDWKDGRGKSAGSIAQDWKPLIPELVHGEEGNMTLAYGQIALVNTILLARKSESHEKRIKELEARVAELEMENERLRMN